MDGLTRFCRYSLGLAAVMLIIGSSCAAQTPTPPVFGYQEVVDRAADLAGKPFKEPDKIPDFLNKIDYDHWRDIRFRPERAIWRQDKKLFEIQFFHPGSFYNQTVKVNLVGPEGVQPVPFSPDLFDYGMNTFKDRIPKDLEFAGFRLHYPLNRPDYFDEVIAFLGASYFRALGRGQQYGLSARALAVDTALDKGEEFPFFKEFWIVTPASDQKTIMIYALLDSPSLSGAYEFLVRPGDETQIDVKSTLFFRKSVQKLGLAPLTSMFFYGENTNQRPIDDFRPEIHDSDGFLFAAGPAIRIFRPLRNPRTLSITTYPVNELKGFGLVQRDQNFDHYQDLETYYNRRPSVWITPEGQWGTGRLELIEIPSAQEIHDNIVAFWVPQQSPAPGRPHSFDYRMGWYLENTASEPLATVAATRVSEFNHDKKGRRFLIDFTGSKIASMIGNTPLNAQITIGPGAHLKEQQIQLNPFNKSLRLTFAIEMDDQSALEKLEKVMPQNRRTIDLQAVLRQDKEVVSETWQYRMEY